MTAKFLFGNFNPIIGLILTRYTDYSIKYDVVFQSHYRSDFNTQERTEVYCNKYFNPIIGLILTLSAPVISRHSLFQSHYRSDFNFKTSPIFRA